MWDALVAVFAGLGDVVVAFGELILTPPLLPLIVWCGFWLFGVDWTRLRIVLLRGGWIAVLLVGIVMVLSAVFIPMAFFGGSTGEGVDLYRSVCGDARSREPAPMLLYQQFPGAVDRVHSLQHLCRGELPLPPHLEIEGASREGEGVEDEGLELGSFYRHGLAVSIDGIEAFADRVEGERG